MRTPDNFETLIALKPAVQAWLISLARSSSPRAGRVKAQVPLVNMIAEALWVDALLPFSRAATKPYPIAIIINTFEFGIETDSSSVVFAVNADGVKN